MYGKALEIPPMKVWKLPKNKEHMRSVVCSNGEYFGQVKKDGFWYEIEIDDDGNTFMFARDKSTITGHLTEKSSRVPHVIEEIKEVFPKGSIIIGEIYYPRRGATSNDVNQIMSATPEEAVRRQQGEYGYLHFYMHDIIRYSGTSLLDCTNLERWELLKNICKWYPDCLPYPQYLELAEEIEGDMDVAIDRLIEDGEEGAVLKLKGGKYIPGKRPAWNTIKFKCETEADVVCIGYSEPTMDYTGNEPLDNWKYWWDDVENVPITPDKMSIRPCAEAQQYGYTAVSKPYWHGYAGGIKIGIVKDGNIVPIMNSDGHPATVWSGLSDETLEDIKRNGDKYINTRPLKVRCMQIYPNGSLRHPVFFSWRDDLNVEDCTYEKLIG